MAKQNKKPQGPGFKAKKGTMPRLIRLLFTDYPLLLTVVLICLVVTAVAGAIPSAFMGKIILYIEEGLKSGLDTVYAGIARNCGRTVGNLSGISALLISLHPPDGHCYTGISQ